MAEKRGGLAVLVLFLFLLRAEGTGNVVVITTGNFSELLTGEWMVEL